MSLISNNLTAVCVWCVCLCAGFLRGPLPQTHCSALPAEDTHILRAAGGLLFVACFDFLQVLLLKSNCPNVELPVLRNSLCSACSFTVSSGCFSLRCPRPCAQIPARPLRCLLSPPATVEAEIHSKRLKFLPHLSRSSPQCPRGPSGNPVLNPVHQILHYKWSQV